MKKIFTFLIAAVCLAACSPAEKQLRQRAAELCRYIPDHELQEKSKDYMTSDFYALLDTMFNRLPEFEGMDNEWLYYFVTGNGGTLPEYKVTDVKKIDDTHAEATITVRQKWEDGSYAGEEETEHKLYMEKVGEEWLMSDFDGHRTDCIRHIALNKKEQAVRQAINGYLVEEVGAHYLNGQFCIPMMIMVHEEEGLFMGDFWVFWYNQSGDTLITVSGGNHSGCMTLQRQCGKYAVTSFEQTEDGAGNEANAKRIFGSYYDIYRNIHSNENVRETVRKEQLREYVKRHNLNVRYYQDYGWEAVEL